MNASGSWAETLRFYEAGGPVCSSMLDLVRSIAGTPHASGLFPVPSADGGLRIGRVRDRKPGENEIFIRFDAVTQQFVFEYRQGPDEESPWSRTCAPAEARQTFERLLHQKLRWFHEG